MSDFSKSFSFYYNNPFANRIKVFKVKMKLLNELNKTGLVYPAEVRVKFGKLNTINNGILSLSTITLVLFFWKVKIFSFLNKITLGGLFIYIIFTTNNERINNMLINELILSDSHIGHEARVLTKWFIPDHSKIYLIEEKINQFQEKRRKVKEEVENKRVIIENIIMKEKDEEEKFIEKMEEKLLKKEN